MINNFQQSALSIKLDERSKYLRKKVIQILEHSRRGHLGSTMSIIEIIRVLYDHILKYNVNNLIDPNRDRFILSKGHGCLALYVVLADKKFISEEELTKFCQSNSILGGHPDGHIPGVEFSTGSLGHGLSIGTGLALAAKLDKRKNRVIVLVGDGEINEGSTWEAAMSALKHKLSNLTVVIDYNKIQSYGLTSEVLDLEPLAKKWTSFGFLVKEINGHDIKQIKEFFLNNLSIENDRPTALICHTVKGKGFAFAENNPNWHHKSKISDEEIKLFYDSI